MATQAAWESREHPCSYELQQVVNHAVLVLPSRPTCRSKLYAHEDSRRTLRIQNPTGELSIIEASEAASRFNISPKVYHSSDFLASFWDLLVLLQAFEPLQFGTAGDNSLRVKDITCSLPSIITICFASRPLKKEAFAGTEAKKRRNIRSEASPVRMFRLLLATIPAKCFASEAPIDEDYNGSPLCWPLKRYSPSPSISMGAPMVVPGCVQLLRSTLQGKSFVQGSVGSLVETVQWKSQCWTVSLWKSH